MLPSFLLTSVIMLCFWFLLSGQMDPLLLSLGVISSLLVAMWSHDIFLGKAAIGPGLARIFRLVRYSPWLFWQIVLANYYLIYLTLHPKLPIDPQFIELDTDYKTDMGVVTLANSITLTPGTVTIEANYNKFLVHCIDLNAAGSLLSGEMQARVKEVEGDV